jgi:serine/threonine protein kinase
MTGFETLENTSTLAHRLAEGPIPTPEAVRYALQIGEALRAIHEEGGVCGRLCPATIAMGDRPVRLIPTHHADDAATPYAAPEVLAGHPPDALSDIFSFGAIVYEILTGRRAFEGSDRSTLPESSSAALNHLVAGCVAANPRMRQQSVRRVVIELKLFQVRVGRLEAAARAKTLSGSDVTLGKELAASPTRRILASPREGFYRLVAGSIACIRETGRHCYLATEILIGVTALAAGIVCGAGMASPESQTSRLTSPLESTTRAANLVASSGDSVKPIVKRDPDAGAGATCFTSPALPRPPAVAAQTSPTGTIQEIVAAIAAYESLPPELLHSVIKVESNYNPNIVSPQGAQGLMQLVPSIAQEFGVNNAFSPVENIQGGAKYLRHLLNLYKGDYVKALAAYNAGEGAVAKFGGVPPYAETRQYLAEVRKQLEKSLATQAAAKLDPVNADSGAYLHRLPGVHYPGAACQD